MFPSDDDRLAWLDTLAEVCKRSNWVCHAYCQMTSHYHLLIETPDANLSKGVRQSKRHAPFEWCLYPALQPQPRPCRPCVSRALQEPVENLNGTCVLWNASVDTLLQQAKARIGALNQRPPELTRYLF
ncbi:MAG: hypothetical protein ABIQ03_09555 [Burkholderiales bacterium]